MSHMSDKPLVSILSPCYNGEKYLPIFLNSVLDQTYTNIELCLVNDGSTDNTQNIIEDYLSRFKERGMILKYAYQENSGQAEAINQAMKMFSGDYIMWSDSDDILTSDNVEKKIDFLEKNTEYGFVLSQYASVSENDTDKMIGITGRKHEGTEDKVFEDMVDGRNIVFGPGTVMVRKKAFLESFPDLHIHPSREGQNWQLMLPLTYMHKCGYIDEPLMKRIVHTDSHSNKKRSSDEMIKRNDGICELITVSLSNIPGISGKDKKRWIKYVNLKYGKANHRISLEANDTEKIKKYRQFLKANGYYGFILSEIKYKIFKK